jgi:hypothetical protein
MPEQPEPHEPEPKKRFSRNRDTRSVSLTIALLTLVLTAISAVKTRSDSIAALLQKKADDQWEYYVAKNQRQVADRIFLDTLSYSTVRDEQLASKLEGKYSAEAERYQAEKQEIQGIARELEKGREAQGRRGSRLDMARSFIEIAQLLASMMLFYRWRPLWYAGIATGIVGVLVAATSLVVY